MKTHRLLHLVCGSLLAVGLLLTLAETRSRAAVTAGDLGANTEVPYTNNTADPSAEPVSKEEQVSAQYAWPHEPWASLPPLPETHYAVVRLRPLGWPIGNGAPIDAIGGAAPAFELDDHNGVLGLRHWTPPYGTGHQAIYLRPGMGQAVDVPVIWRPFNFWDFGPWWAWPWQHFPGFWGGSNRVLNHHGLVAGWTLAIDTDLNGASAIYGTTPSVWSLDGGVRSLSAPNGGTYAMPSADGGWEWSSLDIATAAGVNAYGQVIVWQTGLYDESYYSSENYPNGSSTSEWGVSTNLSSSAWLIDAANLVAPISALGGSLDFWYWEIGESSTPADPVPPPEGWGPEGPPEPAPGTYSVSSDGGGPDGDAFVPQFINDDGVVAGLHVTAAEEWTDWNEDGLWEWEAWYTWTPAIYTTDGLIELPLGPVDDVGVTGLTNGWYDSEGHQLAPPVAYGWSWRADTGYEAWWAHEEGTNGEWVLAPVRAYPAEAGVPSLQGESVSPAVLGGGLKRMNDRLELLVSWFAGGDNYIVRNSRVYDLKSLVSDGWKLWLAQDLNNSGVILAQATSPADLAASLAQNEDGWNPRQPVLLVPATLRVDADRDGVISVHEPLPSAANPFRFWVNDDKDVGPMFTGHNDDVPLPANDSASNAADGQVNGLRDLVDFFPVYLDLWNLLELLPPGDSFTYHLRQADGALNAVFTDCTADNASYHLRGDPGYLATGSGYGPALNQPAGSATVAHVTAAGVELPPAFVSGLWEYGDGVILIEGRTPTTAPLVLEVRKNGAAVASVDLPLRLGNVEDMFRHLNLTTVPKNYDGSALAPPEQAAPTSTGEPSDYPDSLTNGKYFVFVHGFNVDATRARGWNVEVFKRLHALGSHARFVGVSWNGATGVKLAGSYTDYHQAVFNAFQTGNALAGELSFTNGADVTVAAHSLGNMVVSHAIQDGGFAPARYFLLNAATPIEAYTGADAVDNMVEKEWREYAPRLYASNWHSLFPSSDYRSKLTWENRFQSIIESGLGHSFYSPGDEVVANAAEMEEVSVIAMLLQWEFSYGAWKMQELGKGLEWSDTVAATTLERGQGGWRFNSGTTGWHVVTGQTNGATLTRRLFPAEATVAAVPDVALKTKPFFGLFLEAGLTSTNSVTASNLAGNPWVQYDVLARGIPAKSHAMAANFVSEFGNRTFNMQALGRVKYPNSDQYQWPVEGHPENDDKRRNQWLHSDFKDVALPYVRPMFEEMINRGALK